MSETPLSTTPRRRRFAPLIVVGGIAATVLLALSTSGVLSAFTASITNNANSIGAGTLLMSETQGGTTCLSSTGNTISTANAGTCAGINKFNGTSVAVPGVPVTSTVTITNVGTIAAQTFTLTPSACSAAATGTPAGAGLASFCGVVNLTINDDTTGSCVFPVAATACAAPSAGGTLAGLATGGALNLPVPVAPGASAAFTFTVMVSPTAATNDHQGLTASQSLAWSFVS